VDILVLSRAPSFERHLANAIGDTHKLRMLRSPEKVMAAPGDTGVFLLHVSSFPGSLSGLLAQLAERSGTIIAAASDEPNLEEMLSLTQYGIRAYCNSYMADAHYQHMLRLLAAGQTWFAPHLLARALELARRSSAGASIENTLKQLTPRQRDVALAVAQGMSNKRIAKSLGITERTVKTHLTSVFEKLGVKDRVSLAIRLNARTPEQSAGEA